MEVREHALRTRGACVTVVTATSVMVVTADYLFREYVGVEPD